MQTERGFFTQQTRKGNWTEGKIGREARKDLRNKERKAGQRMQTRELWCLEEMRPTLTLHTDWEEHTQAEERKCRAAAASS